MKTILMMLTLTAAAVTAPMPASAQNQDTLPSISVTPRQVAVNYGDLDVRSTWGRRVLDQRLDDATVQVCRYYRGRLEEVQAENRCRHGAKMDALAQVRDNEARRIDMASARSAESASVLVSTH